MITKNEKWILRVIIGTLILGLVGIIITIMVYYFRNHLSFSQDLAFNKLDAFGQFIGGFIGTIFTFAATILIWLTYKTQKEELSRTVEIAKNQSWTLKIQQFENTYFNLLENLHGLIGNMTSINGDMKGQQYLHDLFEAYKISVENDKAYQTLKIATKDTTKLEELELIKKSLMEHYNPLFEQNSFNLGHFFRYIHNIIKYVNDELSEYEILRKKYLSFLQAQLSNDELAFIMYNSLSKYSLDKNNNPTFKEYIDYYGLLENIDNDCVLHSQLSEFFPNTKFFFKRIAVA